MQRAPAPTVLVAALVVATIGGCNAVLGIEEAEHMPDAGSVGGSSGGMGQSAQQPLVVPDTNCDRPDDACASCIAQYCQSDVNGELGTLQGRVSLDDYRACLGSQCTDTMLSGCREATLKSTLAVCIGTNCDSQCSGSSLVSTCQLYCSCMAANCTDHVQQYHPGGNCLNWCLQTPLEDLACQWAHCEYAPVRDTHCDHAVGIDECPRPGVTLSCTNRRIAGWTCSAGEECCSGDCDPTRQMCN